MAGTGLLPPVPTPGFFHLDLFIKDTTDVSKRYDELKARLDLEKGPMESAITNLLSVSAFYQLGGQSDALDFLEGLTNNDKNNLNAIANKQFIYGQIMRAKDEMACRDRLQELLSDESDAATARNARCFAEQGYAMAFVRDNSKDMVSKIRQAISLFRTALRLVSNIGIDVVSEEERLVWKHHLGIAYWLLDNIREHTEDKATSSHMNDDRTEGLLEAQRLFIEVTKMDLSWKHSRFYIARAWGMLGTLEHKCRVKCEQYQSPDYLVGQIPQAEGPGLEWGCYKKALEINPTDYEVYRRFGQSYNRQHLFENARQMLDTSIDLMPEKTSNWFAYYSRSRLNLFQYDMLMRRWRRVGSPPPDKQLLQRAKLDAITSCEGVRTHFNTFLLGKVCHRLAIYPANEVVDMDELENSLDSFAKALQLENGYTDHKIHAARAWSLEVAGQHEMAVESYKRAVEKDEPTYFSNFNGVLRSLLVLHGSKDHHRGHHIAELAFWINEGYKKYEDEVLRGPIRYCVARFGSQMIQVCRHLIDEGNFQLARICLRCFKQQDGIKSYKTATLLISEIPEDDEHGASVAAGRSSTSQSEQDVFNKPAPVRVENSRCNQEFHYDFFVLHSSRDTRWVNYVLVPALEVDWRFKGCVADRDFMLGKSVFNNIIYSIENSYKTLLILTPNFVTSEWCKYETEQALMESLKSKSGRVIPIMLHECEVPASVTHLDASRDAIGCYDWLKLKETLEKKL
ncbi:tetratricopeptide repeat protein 22-like [Branchiostoma floridae x Branchiostoma japonicum]